MSERVLPQGLEVIAFPASASSAVSASCLAVALSGVAREVALAAPLIVTCWVQSVAAAARADGVHIRAEPVITADLAGVMAEVLPAERDALRAFPGWFAAARLAHRPAPLDRLRAACLAGMPSVGYGSGEVRRALFGDRHRYGVSQAERVNCIRQLTVSDLDAAAAALLTAPAILAAPAPIVTALAQAPRSPAAIGPSAAISTTAAAGLVGGRPRVVRIAGEQAFYSAGTPGVALASEAKFPLHVAWAMLSGREGLLDQRLRGERAMTYSLAAFSRELAEGGYGMCYARCQPRAIGEVATEVKGVLARLCAGSTDLVRLRSAKERLIIQYHRVQQSERGIAERLCGYQIAGIGPGRAEEYPDRVAAVTAGQVRAAAAAYLAPERLLETWLLPAEISPQRGRELLDESKGGGALDEFEAVPRVEFRE